MRLVAPCPGGPFLEGVFTTHSLEHAQKQKLKNRLRKKMAGF